MFQSPGNGEVNRSESKVHIILGGTGHIGSVLADLLLASGEAVTVVTSDASKRKSLEGKGFQVAVVDIHNVTALREVFQRGQRAFLLNPPAAPATDTDAEERKSVKAILDALDGSGLKKVVAESTYGAQSAKRSGDLGILYDLEQGLKQQAIPASVIRGAYYMSNWDTALQTAQAEGVVHTMFPVDFEMPMVDPADIAHVAARLMTEAIEHTGLHYVEGPEKYTANDVAEAFSKALGKPVRAVETSRDQWVATFQALGFSDEAAQSYAQMTVVTLEQKYDIPDSPVRGRTSLQDYVTRLVKQQEGQ
jgi:uncharacterized protein YbjT (DUF2867 family)